MDKQRQVYEALLDLISHGGSHGEMGGDGLYVHTKNGGDGFVVVWPTVLETRYTIDIRDSVSDAPTGWSKPLSEIDLATDEWFNEVDDRLDEAHLMCECDDN